MPHYLTARKEGGDHHWGPASEQAREGRCTPEARLAATSLAPWVHPGPKPQMLHSLFPPRSCGNHQPKPSLPPRQSITSSPARRCILLPPQTQLVGLSQRGLLHRVHITFPRTQQPSQSHLIRSLLCLCLTRSQSYRRSLFLQGRTTSRSLIIETKQQPHTQNQPPPSLDLVFKYLHQAPALRCLSWDHRVLPGSAARYLNPHCSSLSHHPSWPDRRHRHHRQPTSNLAHTNSIPPPPRTQRALSALLITSWINSSSSSRRSSSRPSSPRRRRQVVSTALLAAAFTLPIAEALRR